MSIWVLVAISAAGIILFLLVYMLAQRPPSREQRSIQQGRYVEAIAESDRALAKNPDDSAAHLHRAEALKLLGRFDDAIDSYRRANDPAAREGIALCLAHAGRELDVAKRLMNEQIAQFPAIQEFQALALAYILLRAGEREAALRTFNDNIELLETRFRDDYTDPDPLLAETLWIFAVLCDANGDPNAAMLLRQRAAEWAPGTVWAKR